MVDHDLTSTTQRSSRFGHEPAGLIARTLRLARLLSNTNIDNRTPSARVAAVLVDGRMAAALRDHWGTRSKTAGARTAAAEFCSMVGSQRHRAFRRAHCTVSVRLVRRWHTANYVSAYAKTYSRWAPARASGSHTGRRQFGGTLYVLHGEGRPRQLRDSSDHLCDGRAFKLVYRGTCRSAAFQPTATLASIRRTTRVQHVTFTFLGDRSRPPVNRHLQSVRRAGRRLNLSAAASSRRPRRPHIFILCESLTCAPRRRSRRDGDVHTPPPISSRRGSRPRRRLFRPAAAAGSIL